VENLTSRLLMGPGPSNPYPEVTSALTYPVLGHLDPVFLGIMDETMTRLRQVFDTNNALTLPLSGTGSAGMEAAFVNLVEPGDVVVVGVNGVFGERMVEVATRQGATVVRVDGEWGKPLDPQRLLSAHAHPKIISLVHAETSTGVENDLATVGKNKGDALLIADMVTSLAGIPLSLDEWGVDLAYSGTQKCLGVPPGLSPLSVSDRARAKLRKRPPNWYLDLTLLSAYVEAGEGSARVYHHTAPVTMIGALHAGLGAVLSEGLPAVWARHAACGALLRSGLEEMGLELLVAEGHHLPQLTTVLVPQNIPGGHDEAWVRQRLLEEYSIEIGAGAGQLAKKVWRIGCMGHTARPGNVLMLLAALREVLDR
jgi:alanine-glyoxylate transaminase/serine-glyoxylate transaminase/serine-pyruvate transaminase